MIPARVLLPRLPALDQLGGEPLELFGGKGRRDSVALVALIFLGGALSFLYMFQIYQHDFWRGERRGADSPAALRGVAVAFAALVVVLGLWPEPLLAAGREAAEALMGPS